MHDTGGVETLPTLPPRLNAELIRNVDDAAGEDLLLMLDRAELRMLLGNHLAVMDLFMSWMSETQAVRKDVRDLERLVARQRAIIRNLFEEEQPVGRAKQILVQLEDLLCQQRERLGSPKSPPPVSDSDST